MTDAIVKSAGENIAGEPNPGADYVASHSHMTHRQILVVMSGLMLGLFLAALDQTIIATALPQIAGDLGGIKYIPWVVAAYLLTSTVTTPLYGKISDLYGRKGIFQFAIVVFLIGSALCGLSQNIWELIAFRAIQGLGGGGLMALAMAIMGDIVSPRDRGKYQGLFGAVFALSTIVGPLIGGSLVEVSWRWVFYVNVPVGIVALVVIGAVLKFDFVKRERSIDYTGAALIAGSISALLLVTVWGGTQYAWGSSIIVGLAIGGTIGVLVFLAWEARAPEPLLPLYLFRNSIFNVASAVSFILSLTMFGAVIYLPVYFQLVRDDSPVIAGLMLIPIMLGMIVTSTWSGFMVSKLGRYKVFPIIGCSVMVVSLWLMSSVTIETSYGTLAWKMVLLGVGMGLIMQIMIIATQNAVDIRDLGTATSANRFFGTMGGAFGTALLGAILTSRLNYWIPRLVPPVVARKFAGHATELVNSPSAVHELPPLVRKGVEEAFVRGLHTEFVVTVPFAIVALLLTLILREVKLRTTSGLHEAREAAADAQMALEVTPVPDGTPVTAS